MITTSTTTAAPIVQHDPIVLPHTRRDYGSIWADAVAAEGGDPVATARKLGFYRDAIDAVERGELRLPGLDGAHFARAVKDYVAAHFADRVSTREPDNTWHQALIAHLHKQAVDCLRTGDLPGFPENPEAADTIENVVRRRLLQHYER